MMTTMKKAIVVATLPIALVTFAVFVMLAIMPGYLDEFLLTNDDYCYLSVESGSGSGSRSQPSIKVDFGEYERQMQMMPDNIHAQRSLQQQKQATAWQNGDSLLRRVMHGILWRVSLHFWEKSKEEHDSAAPNCSIHNEEKQQSVKGHNGQNELQQCKFNEDTVSRKLHPMCEVYRTLRTRIRFQQLLLPWNWYYRNELHFRGLTFHSLADEVSFVSRTDNAQSSGWMHVRNLLFGRESARVDTDPRVKNNPTGQSSASSSSASHLPPSLEIDAVDISFQSWTRPVVSAEFHGITINIVVQKGGLTLPLQLDSHDIARVANSSALMIGAMPIQEALLLLPKPPDQWGLYPRIGFINISNVTVNIYENKATNDRSPLNLMLKMRIPDKFFHPITNMTHAYKEAGIDQKDFQLMMESRMSNALRRHLLREATAALRNSWAHAHKAQEQIQQFVDKAQTVYLDRWIGMGVQAWHQTQENVWKGVVNGTAPLVKVVEQWAADLKEIVSDPVPPVAVVVSHYRNRTMEGIHKYGIFSNDKQIWGHFNDFKREKRISKQFGELRNAFDAFIAKSGHDLELLVKSCEMEVKDMWLAWHLQFMPDL